MAVSVTGFEWFLPIFAFLLVFFVVYALLSKSSILGDSQPVLLFISFILASFFIVEASLVDFVQFSSAWFSVIVIAVFFLLMILAFLPGDKPLEFLSKGSWLGWVLIGVMVALFIASAAYAFNWALNWETISLWVESDWFGLVLLLIIAAVVSWRIAPVAGK